MTCKIKKITHPFPFETLQARIDEAAVTGKPLIERPFYYQNIETGAKYYEFYGCIGWPTEVSETDDGQPGYVSVIAACKPKDEDEEFNPQDAKFLIMEEFEHKDVPTLLREMVAMRETWGFGLHPDMLQTWTGDPKRFIQMIALYNEKLNAYNGGGKLSILIAPPNDFYEKKPFDIYARSLQSTVIKGRQRLFYGGCTILKNKMIGEFRRDDPAVMAAGGLVHSMLLRCQWLDQRRENMFVIQDETDKDLNKRQKEGGSYV